ncbi:hypothetical protein CFC21_056872 [Triticum aestivum]|uniref:Serpin domain-containing protein n=2 Tax=Triticum aestivum TaxID=4565 RepID=A0A3B6IPK0_WHEAT|nr:putative serpin-Z8 [Triticum aestivum]KAF7048055.1 hypothetical protein CFC21_056872 [Triticum aestivum]
MTGGLEARPSKKRRQSGSGLAEFVTRITKHLADASPRGNMVFSPLSIYAAVALLAPGARGETLDEILRLLGVHSRDELEDLISRVAADALKDQSQSGGPSVAFACGVWNDKARPLKTAYRETIVGTYKAKSRAVDFRGNAGKAARRINAWAARVTGNLITAIVSPKSFGPATDVVLGNAIYFKGKWDLPFYQRMTKDRPFHRLDGTTVDAPFMRNSGRHFIAVYDGFKVLKLRYEMPRAKPLGWTVNFKKTTPRYSMCIFLPDAYDGLQGLVEEITSRPTFLHEHLPTSQVRVGEFGVPKFKLSFQSSVIQTLKHLGLLLPFGMGADLSDMVEDDGSGLPLVVNDVFHKAVIEVNEQGTEAAADTTTKIYGLAMPRPTPTTDFVADHPFAYFIFEEASGAIIFAGHVVDPSSGGDSQVRIGRPRKG